MDSIGKVWDLILLLGGIIRGDIESIIGGVLILIFIIFMVKFIRWEERKQTTR